MKKIALFFVVILFFFADFVMAQQDTVLHQLDGVRITAKERNETILTTTSLQIIEKEHFKELPAIQLSDVLKLFSGVVIRDYGGVGGMKTVSIRGFGAQHTAVAYDGIAVSDCQTGQIDLGKFSLNNLKQISLNSGTPVDIFLPARLFASAGVININTLKPIFKSNKPCNLRVNLTGGSFGLLNPSILLENRICKVKSDSMPFISSSLNINYLQSNGNYPFTIYYGNAGDSTSQERRANSDVRTLSAEENLYFNFRSRGQMNMKFYYFQSERGLPGAVVLYNTHARQRLADLNAFGQVHYINYSSSKVVYQLNAKFNFASQHYIDPDYLNDERNLENLYSQREYYLSNTVMYLPHRRVSLSLSNDLMYNNMSANLTDFSKPSRWTVYTALSLLWNPKHLTLRAGLLHTGVANRTEKGAAGKNISRFSPAVGLLVQPLLSEDWVFRFYYKNVFRLPTFNDLYYRETGNISLKPENTHQFNVGVGYAKSLRKNRFHAYCNVDGYYNRVTDKIIAIPNKNLFIWSMINFGEVEIAGVDVNASILYQIIKQLQIELNGSYGYQYAVDISDSQSKTYRHQIPYTPLHSGSASVSVRTPWVDFCYSLIVSGSRYALQQNVKSNLLAPYTDHSIVLSKDFKIKKITLGGKIELLNIADQHYEIIRNYPMQGRSLRVSVIFGY